MKATAKKMIMKIIIKIIKIIKIIIKIMIIIKVKKKLLT
jgi:hypothetical protein